MCSYPYPDGYGRVLDSLVGRHGGMLLCEEWDDWNLCEDVVGGTENCCNGGGVRECCDA